MQCMSALTKGMVTLFLILILSVANGQQENLSVYPEWKYYGDMSNTLYRQLCETAFEQLDQRQARIDGLKDVADHRKYQQEVKSTLKEIIGKLPDKTPLNPVITGVVRKPGYRVEKLYFESLPGYYVTAALFVPENVTGKFPAILYCSGHTNEGFRGENYQQVILNFVKKGFAVLAFDPIGQGERVQYFDEQGERMFNSTKEHSYPGTQIFLSGRSPAYYFIWDGIRALDYLASREDIIDTNRIGVAGRSGGGTQSTFISAMDDRVQASVTEAYITTYDKLLRSVGPTDAEQTLFHALHRRLDIPDYLIARAPKPVMVVSTTRDFFSIQGAQDAFEQAKAFYRAYGRDDDAHFVMDDGPHGSTRKNRESAYGFFQKYLDNPGSPVEEDVAYLDSASLVVTRDGNVFTSLGSKTLFDLNQDYLSLQAADNDPVRSRDSIGQQVRFLSGYSALNPQDSGIFSGRVQRPKYAVEKYLIKGSGNYFIPLLWFRPSSPGNKTVILMDKEGKEKAAELKGLADQLAAQGFNVVLPDLIGVGELGGGFDRGSAFIQQTPLNVWYLGVLTGKSITSLRMAEIKILHDFVKKRTGGASTVTAIATGSLCTDLLHGNAMEGLFEQMVLINPLLSLGDLARERNYQAKYVMSAVPGFLRKYDIGDLVTLSPSATRILAINPVMANGEIGNEKSIKKAYLGVLDGKAKAGNKILFVQDDGYLASIRQFLE